MSWTLSWHVMDLSKSRAVDNTIFPWRNIYITICLQLLASGYILGKEYYEIVALQIFSYDTIRLFRKKNFLIINIFGIICTFFFLFPLVNLIAPIISIIIITTLIDKINKNSNVN